MITYKTPSPRQEKQGIRVIVLLDGDVLGHIVENFSWYAYRAEGLSLTGNNFPTIEEVKQSIEKSV